MSSDLRATLPLEGGGSPLEIRLGDPVGHERYTTVSAILDLDPLGTVVGVEVINLRDQLRAPCYVSRFGAEPGGRLRSVAYDDDVDALYIRLSEGRATAQKPADVDIGIDSRHELVSLRVNGG